MTRIQTKVEILHFLHVIFVVHNGRSGAEVAIRDVFMLKRDIAHQLITSEGFVDPVDASGSGCFWCFIKAQPLFVGFNPQSTRDLVVVILNSMY